MSNPNYNINHKRKYNSTNDIIQNRLQKLINNLSQEFELSKISKSPARFSTEKLTWFNREYIKMMCLEEFCYRASRLKIHNSNNQILEDKNLRVGDYVYLVDISKQKVFISRFKTKTGQDGESYCVGGGRDVGESSQQGLVREVTEETKGQIQIDPDQLIPLAHIKVLSAKKWINENQERDGKDMTFYIYEITTDQLSEYTEEVIDYCIQDPIKTYSWLFQWHDISDVIVTNDYVNYPIWQETCNQNNLTCFAPTIKIKQQYLAWNLDKNRATTLLDFGIESDCILHYIPCPSEDLKWKKITLEESLVNLTEILKFIQKEYDTNPIENNLEQTAINDLPEYFDQSVLSWETKLKNWLKDNNKDTGSHLWPLRVALSGKSKSPSPFEILAILTQEEVTSRIQGYIKF